MPEPATVAIFQVWIAGTYAGQDSASNGN